VQSKESRPGEFVLQGLPDLQPWDSDVVLYVEDRITPTFKLTANAIFSAGHGDSYLNPSAQYNWTDNFKTILSADFFLGSRNGFFGQFADNRRTNLMMIYLF
jgi:hypothetical protein